jgi:arylsulfatase A-like enzyme
MRQDDADYAGMVENVDENVARVLTLLREKGLEQNTIVVVSSDHGGLSNDGENQRRLATTNEPLRAGKGWLYEGGIRVPLLMRWPARIEPRVESRAIILGMDVMPTLLDLATDGALANVDGESFEDVIDANADWSRRTVYWHSSKARPYSTGDYPASAIREGDYKLVDFFTQGRTELYNLANDPSERADLSATEPAKTKSMKQKLDAWRAAEGVSTSAAKAKTGKANRAKRTKRATEE